MMRWWVTGLVQIRGTDDAIRANRTFLQKRDIFTQLTMYNIESVYGRRAL
jgi:hypothetical protein